MRNCPDCGGIQEWEEVGEMIKGQGSVGFTWICTECGFSATAGLAIIKKLKV